MLLYYYIVDILSNINYAGYDIIMMLIGQAHDQGKVGLLRKQEKHKQSTDY